jgi:hypothetical protein
LKIKKFRIGTGSVVFIACLAVAISLVGASLSIGQDSPKPAPESALLSDPRIPDRLRAQLEQALTDRQAAASNTPVPNLLESLRQQIDEAAQVVATQPWVPAGDGRLVDRVVNDDPYYAFVNRWDRDVHHTTIFVRVGALLKDPEQGVVQVACFRGSAIGRGIPDAEVALWTPTREGAVTITGATGAILNLATKTGVTWLFDVDTLSFLAPDSKTAVSSGSIPADQARVGGPPTFSADSVDCDSADPTPTPSAGAAIFVDTKTGGNRSTEVSPADSCASVSLGTGVTVDVTAQDIPSPDGVAAVQFLLSYDPSILKPKAVDVNMLLASNSDSNVIDVSPGVNEVPGVLLIAAVDLGPGQGEAGDGVLARVTFDTIGKGTSPLTLSGVIVASTPQSEAKLSAVQSGRLSVDEGCADGAVGD